MPISRRFHQLHQHPIRALRMHKNIPVPARAHLNPLRNQPHPALLQPLHRLRQIRHSQRHMMQPLPVPRQKPPYRRIGIRSLQQLNPASANLQHRHPNLLPRHFLDPRNPHSNRLIKPHRSLNRPHSNPQMVKHYLLI